MPGWKLDPSPETKQKVIRGNKRSTSGWFAAVERGEEERMKQLLAEGHDVNQQDSQCRWAAIYYAAWKNRIWQAELLLESGADLTLESNEGDTAIHVAARNGHAEMLRLLLRSAVVSSKNEFGKTPLDLARQKNHWGSVAALEEAYGLPLSAEVTDPPSPLPKNWLDGDYGNGQKFYYNPFSGETSETRPAAP